MSILLFVYGTLKQGFSRHHALGAERYLGTAITKSEYAMYTLGGYPCLLNKSLSEKRGVEANTHVYGEIYEVSQECLSNLDRIEGVEYDLFERLPVNIETFTFTRLPLLKSVWQDIENKQAQAYFYKQEIKGAANCGSYWHKR
jgi:gamma-glutamylcyclotransferase (GGCT)/AIG2-like uncharacterized protein YtfP